MDKHYQTACMSPDECSTVPGLMNTPEGENKKGVQEVAQNIQGHQKGTQNLEALGYLESSQETEIENILKLQGVDSSRVKGVLPRKREVRPVGIEPTTLDLGNRCSIP